MLSTEVRDLMVKAYEKSHNATEVAKNFSISLTTVYDHVNRMRETGSVAVQTDKRGRKLECFPNYLMLLISLFSLFLNLLACKGIFMECYK